MYRTQLLLAAFLMVCSFSLAQVTANFGVDLPTSCMFPHIVQFSDSSTGAITSYQWDFGNGFTSGLANPSTIYVAPGTYTVTLIVSDGISSDTLTRIAYIRVAASSPTADFHANIQAGCVPFSPSFTNTSTDATSYLWDFGDGATTTQTNPTHTYVTGGTYTVKLYAYFADGSNGCVDSLVRTNYIVAEAPPNINVTATPNTACSPPLTTQFLVNAIGTTTWEWNFGDGDTSTTQGNVSHTYTTAGVFDVSLAVESISGCRDSIVFASFIQIDSPEVAIRTDVQTGCVPLMVQFQDATTAPDGVVSWLWDFGDGTTSTFANPVHVYADTGSYDVSLVIQTNDGCIDSILLTDYIMVGEPVQGLDFVVSPPEACAIEPIIFTNTSLSPNVISWTWDFGDGQTFAGMNTVHLYQDTGYFHVSLIGESALGCRDTLTQDSAVKIIEPVALFSINPTLNCTTPATVNFIDQSIVPTSWLWDFGDGTTSTSQNPTHTYANPGSYNVSLTVFNSSTSCSDDIMMVVEIRDPLADFSASATEACVGTPLSFSNLSINATSFLWDFGDGNVSTDASPMYAYTQAGTFDVSLVVSDELGCTDSIVRTHYIDIGNLAVNASFLLSDTCVPATAAFTDISTAVPHDSTLISWAWSFGDGATSTQQNPVHMYNNEGIYGASLIISSSFGCVDTLILDSIQLDCTTPMFSPFACDSLVNCSIGSLGDVTMDSIQIGDVLIWDGSAFMSGSLSIEDADSDPSNEYNHGLQLVGTMLELDDGGGTLSVDLSSLGGASSVWSLTGNDAYYDAGLVGVGTNQPDAQLTIEGQNLGSTPALSIAGTDSLSPGGYSLQVLGHPSGVSAAQHVQITTGNSDSRMTLKCASADDFAPRIQMTGPTDPGSAGWALFDYGSRLQDLPTASFKMRFMPTAGSPIDMIHAEGRDGVYLAPVEGMVGVGTDQPASLLHVAGDIRSDALLGGGNVQADANGNLIIATTPVVDGDSTNELQLLTVSGNQLTISNGNTVSLDVDDADANPLNELIAGMVLNGTQLEVTDAGGVYTVDLSSLSSGGGVVADQDWGFISGNGLNDPIYRVGKVGIGTATPLAKLEVMNGAVLFSGSVGATPVSGGGTRMMWVPEKAAFRAGACMGTEWDDANIGSYSTVVGLASVASGVASTAIGRDNTVSGEGGTAIGRNHLVTGSGATAIGRNNEASAEGSTAFGFSTIASGYAAVSMGLAVEAIGDYSLAAGSATAATGVNSVAFGLNSRADGNYSVAMGMSSEADGNFSFAVGDGAMALGDASSAFGISTQTSYGSLAIGRYNLDNGAEGMWNGSDYAFTVGDGTSTSRSNAMYVKKNGDMWLQGSLSQYSDRRLKEDIYVLKDVMQKLNQLNGVRYHWKDKETMGEEEEIGLIAQEVEGVYPELITEVEGYKAVNYVGLIPVLVEALKDQQQMIDAQSNQLEELLEGFKEQQALIEQLQAQLSPSTDALAPTPSSDSPKLFQNTPNPFQQSTELPYYLPKGTQAAMIVISDVVSGQVLKTYPIGQTGYGKVKIEANTLAAGVYLYTLFVGSQRIESKRMILVD